MAAEKGSVDIARKSSGNDSNAAFQPSLETLRLKRREDARILPVLVVKGDLPLVGLSQVN
jgi:hypothetical protein